MLTNAPRGTKDILPDSVGDWNYVEGEIRELCRRFGYSEIRTPIFEHTELFQRGIGEGTDVVDKEMYTFTDRGDRSITLRPENTASAVRAYLQNKLYAESNLVKLFYIGSMFRYDRPQAGRMREFHQFGVEALGEANPAVDAEVILLAMSLLEGLGLKDLELSINSVGCPKCRSKYRTMLQDFFRDKLDDLCEDCRSRFDRSPLRILDCKKDSDKPYMADAPKITDCLCDECSDHFAKLKEHLANAGISFQHDPRLVRGLDYYTKTAFEIKYPPLGAQSAVAGGGRYDGLIEEMGGSPTPAVGFATGLERLLLALESQNLLPEKNRSVDAYVVALGEAAQSEGFKLLNNLRKAGLSAAMDFAGRSMKAQMKQANKLGARYALILGDDEIAEGVVMLRSMSDSQQEKVALAEVIGKIKA
ncbi:MAG: histidine--tRNA ligase [Anaerovibrio sp.]|uniref:histidine--tRNA ligase n=2 Tax=Selenomonadaceae TaxID=1843491 RepID=UPI0023F2C487|nr:MULTISPECIES: histidine--tRNA ligase [Anaerovibrio]MBQ2011055.1 histidine--tRNA ligase [Selenomonadaceae bacterium]MBQ2410819.1 histidine--tRNA ligase [Selenomonadaceae bacterium]MBQ5585071.1 histidine--tRNA ligase [Selenomonadaceae bacterium]MBQ5650589.1 histidine--tRNA ligase [Selenomonadaceae bacterium]MBQ5732629.1 histidine--tRNA ligase [Selenomonadaceae bacterium]